MKAMRVVCACVAMLGMMIGVCDARTVIVTEQGERFEVAADGLLGPVDALQPNAPEQQYTIVRRYVLDDFDIPRAVGGMKATIMSWTMNPADDTQGCWFAYVTDDAKANQYGQALRIRYDVENRGEAINGVLFDVMNMDLQLFRFVSLWVKGGDKVGFTSTMKIGFRNENGAQAAYPITGITSRWQNYVIDLAEIKDTLQWRTISQVYTFFNSNEVTRRRGMVFIDQVEYLSVK